MISKRHSLIPAIALAAVVALPAASEAQARDCLGLDRVATGVTRVADDVGRTVTRIGDRMFGWLRRDKVSR
jgi:hypothetical protein